MPDPWDPVADFQADNRRGMRQAYENSPIAHAARWAGNAFDTTANALGEAATGLGRFWERQKAGWLPPPTYGPPDPQAGIWQRMVDAVDFDGTARPMALPPPATAQAAPVPPSLRSLKRAGTPTPKAP